MQLKSWLYLRDVVKYGSLAIEIRGDATPQEIAADDVRYYAIERLLYIVGEAVNCAVTREPDIGELLTHASHIRKFRHLLAHGYFKVDRVQICKILFENLELLIEEARAVPEPTDDEF